VFTPVAPDAGTGADAGKYLIASEANLVFLSANITATVPGGGEWREQSFLQTEALDLKGCLFTPIGGTGTTTSFIGTYDGQDNVIVGLSIDREVGNTAMVGMFAHVRAGGVISNVRLVGVTLTVTTTSANPQGIGGGAGALVGNLFGGRVERSSASGTVSTSIPLTGGLIGSVGDSGSEVTDSFADVKVTSTMDRVGGLAGGNRNLIQRSFATGDVEGLNRVGGLVGVVGDGTTQQGSVVDSYARGSVTGASSVGGLIGHVVSTPAAATIVRSYATGQVSESGTSGTGIGGLIGWIFGAGTGGWDYDPTEDQQPANVSVGSFWDAGTSTTAVSLSGTSGTTSEMKTLTTFTAASWSITETCDRTRTESPDTVWGLCATINDGYPFLRIGEVDFAPEAPGENGNGENGQVVSGGEASSAGPVLSAGSVPTLAAGSAVWQQADRTAVPLAASAPSANELLYTADGVSVRLAGGAGTSASGGLIADANGEVACEVCLDLATGNVIEVWMFSTPRLVAAHRIDAEPCQQFTIPVVSPLDGGGPVSAGAHTLQLALPTASGMQAVNVGVTVGGPVPASVPAGEGPTVPLGLLAVGLLAAAGAVVAVRRQVVAG
jgi:hypothetical protein